MSEKEFEKLQFPGAPIIKAKPPGPKSAEIIARQSKLETKGIVYPKSFPVAWDSGKGATLKDADGNVFIDFYAGVGVMNVGHSNPFVLEAIESQARKIIHILDFPSEVKMHFAEKLLEIAPGLLKAAGVIFRRSLDVWEPGQSHFGTFRGNALSSAAGLAAVKYMQENKLVEHSETLGAHALKRFSEIAQKSKTIGEVRGRGLFIGVEIVKDKKSKEPGTELTSEIRKRCFDRGVIFWSAGHYSNVVRFIPPLVVTKELTKELVNRGIDVFSEVLNEVEQDLP